MVDSFDVDADEGPAELSSHALGEVVEAEFDWRHRVETLAKELNARQLCQRGSACSFFLRKKLQKYGLYLYLYLYLSFKVLAAVVARMMPWASLSLVALRHLRW